MIRFQPPIEVEIIATGMPALMIGFLPREDTPDSVLVVQEDGFFGWAALYNVKTNWRYDWREHAWIDVKETDATESDPLDGGEGFSGTVPEPDEFSEGDPVDEEGRQAPGDLGDLDAGEGQ